MCRRSVSEKKLVEKLRAEIVEAQGGEHTDISYDDVIKLPYMDAVCRESLRL